MRVLVVDDSALMRKFLTEIFRAAGCEVAVARDGVDALAQVKACQPDVVTLDINMPGMDGLTCLSRIMVECPCPVVMVSSLTEQGALATLEALHLGAVDYIPKPGGTVSLNLKQIGPLIIEKVQAAAQARLRRRVARPESVRPPSAPPAPPPRTSVPPSDTTGVVLVGVSTGGPSTLEDILPVLPAAFPYAVVVAQHMPAGFTQALAARLGKLCALPVEEVNSPRPLTPAHIYLGRGDADILVGRRQGHPVVLSVPADPRYGWHPSVERLVRSALEHFTASRLIGVELTGMGWDGADALAELRKLGGHTVAESEETAIVFGMPKELIERNGAEAILPAHKIAAQVVRWV
jgi:two-component system, chemotaxis family, protein-glutamate methylesterase/glutaminase